MSSVVLYTRAAILRGIHEFFWARDFLEVETPVVLPTPSQESYLEPLRTIVHDHRGHSHDGFLRMSPEFSIKKLIAALSPTPSRSPSQWDGEKKSNFPTSHREGGRGGVGDQRSGVNGQVSGVFELGSVFRDGEPWGGSHSPEFTMLEWYRLGATYRDLMNGCEALVLHCMSILGASQHRGSSKSKAQSSKQIQKPNVQIEYQNQMIDCTRPWERLTMREAWRRCAKLDLDRLLTRAAMARACRAKGYTVTRGDTFDDLFFKIHLTEVEPKLGRTRPTFLLDWPSQMAALARRKQNNPRYAERVELYIGGLELANGFSELTDADEQLRRFKDDQRLRRKLGKPVYPIDKDFISALRRLPQAAGMALGVDRLVMLLVDAKTIDEVRWLPASGLFGRRSS